MKKTTSIIAAMALATSAAFAQDLTSKKGEPFLPEAGDWAIGIQADPFFSYAKGFFGGNGGYAAAPTFDSYSNNGTLVGKYFVSEKMAYRGIVRLGMRNQSYKHDVVDATSIASGTTAFPTAQTMKQDKLTQKTSMIALGGGIEWRKGKTRLQGYYGADAYIWRSGASNKYTYGNALSAASTSATVGNVDADNSFTTDWSTQATATAASNVVSSAGSIAGQGGVGFNGARLTKEKTSGTIGIGVRGFIGAEYFILPKISIGGEFGWGIGFASSSKIKKTYEAETFGTGTTESTVTVETSVKRGSTFAFDVDKNPTLVNGYNTTALSGLNGALKLTLHF